MRKHTDIFNQKEIIIFLSLIHELVKFTDFI